MLPIIVALLMCLSTLYALRGGLVGQYGFLTIAGFDLNAFGLGIAAVGAAAWFFGPLYGAAVIVSVMVHEFGHVAAYRVCGHSDARFLLIPLIGGVAISNQHPASQEKDFFITLLGPAICMAPMVLAYTISYEYAETYPYLVDFLWTFAMVTGAINFFNLLAFFPLDGGRCLAILCNSFWPGGAWHVTLAMSAAAVAVAIQTQSLSLVFFALLGTQSLTMQHRLSQMQRPIGMARASLALAAYLTTIATFGVVGWPIIAWMF
jgi:Zn-dependent protease